MALRKNAKWNLVDIPDNSYLLPDLPCRQRALRRRFCHFCATPIVQGEEHLSIWRNTSKFYPMRFNMCCLCAKGRLEENLRDVVDLYTYIKKQLKAIDKYSITKDLRTKQIIYHEL